MDNEEVQQLIRQLRRMLVENGFGWVVDEAEADLLPNVALKTRALALIDAAEGATTHLAEVELRALDTLEVDEIHFEPDEETLPDGDKPSGDTMESTALARADRLSGAQRREQLKLLAEKRSAFIMLRRRLDGDE